MNNVDKYRDHLARFHAESTYLCRPFFDAVQSAPEAHLERSCKIGSAGISPLRMNLWYRNDGSTEPESAIKTLVERYVNIADIDLSLYNYLLGSSFRYDKVHYNIVGIDIRPEPQASRLKLWHIVVDYPEIEEAMLTCDGIPQQASWLNVHGGLLFGFDFGFGGTSALKVYPLMHDYEMQEHRQLLHEVFGERMVALTDHCCRVSFGYSTGNSGVTAHMIPYDAAAFVSTSGSQPLADAYATCGASSVIVAMDTAEISAADCRNFNLYY